MNGISTTVTSAKLLLVLTVTIGCGRPDVPKPESQGLLHVSRASKASPALVGRRELPNGVVTEVHGLRVVAPSGDKDDMNMRAFNWNAGTSVAVGISLPQGGIIALDRDASKITAFEDDRGTDLWEGTQASKFSNSQLDMMPQIAEDTRSIVFDVDGQGVPKAGANSLTLRGTVQLWVASDKAKFAAKNVTLKKDITFKVGPRTIKVTKTGAPGFGNKASFATTFRLEGDTADIAEISFLDARGNELSARRQSSYWSGSGKSRVNHWEFVFEEKPVAPIYVVLTQWTDLKKQTVPLDLSFGVGL